MIFIFILVLTIRYQIILLNKDLIFITMSYYFVCLNYQRWLSNKYKANFIKMNYF